jgi:hypothetical protein
MEEDKLEKTFVCEENVLCFILFCYVSIDCGKMYTQPATI